MAFNNPVCEDAPCCGCCGQAVMDAEARSAEEAAFDRQLDDEFWPDDEE